MSLSLAKGSQTFPGTSCVGRLFKKFVYYSKECSAWIFCGNSQNICSYFLARIFKSTSNMSLQQVFGKTELSVTIQ